MNAEVLPKHFQTSARVLCFPGFALDLDREELRVNGQTLPLRPKAFLLMAHFAQRPGCLITKDALVNAVWPDVVVTDDSLTQCVAQLRAALGDGDQRLIKTVRGRGYIFDADVTDNSAGNSPGVATPAVPTAPLKTGATQQQIRFCTSFDGVQLAYSSVGEGAPLVEVGTWINHLEADWNSPVWRFRLKTLAAKNQLVRYDCRGCGLSDRATVDFSFEARIKDLEHVVDAVGLDHFTLSGASQGAGIAIAYAARHPKRVSKLVLYGPIARGRLADNPAEQVREEAQAMHKLVQLGWGRQNPAFRQIFTSLFIPDSTPEQYQWFTELQRTSTSAENASQLIVASDTMDVSELIGQIQCPTLVLHSRGDARVPFEQGRFVATRIKGARFVPLDSQNHILLEQEPALQQFLDELQAFVNQTADLPGQLAPSGPVQARAIKHLKVAAIR